MKYIKQIMLAAALTGAVLLSGCSLIEGGEHGASSAEGTPVPNVTESPAVTEQPAVTESPGVTPPPAEVSAEAVTAAFDEYAAFESYWYKGGNAGAMQAEKVSQEGMEYCRYEGEGISTLQQLEAKALSLMTKELFDTLQSNIAYIDVDGALYGPVNSGRSTETGFAKNESEAVRRSDTEYELKVGHYYYASAFIEDAAADETMLRGETTAIYTKTADGWRFSSVAFKSVGGIAG